MTRPYKRWNREEVLKQLAGLRAKGERLNSGNVARKYPALSYAGRRYIGSWEAVITAAGLDYGDVRLKSSWNREKIVEQLRALKRAGKQMNVSFAESNYGGLAGAANAYFGSWRKAIEAAGFDYATIKRPKKWSKQGIVAEIKRVKRAGVNISTTIEVRKKYRSIHASAIRYFGSWRAALKAAGLEKLYWQSSSRP